MRLIWPFVCLIQYTIEMPRRLGPWLATQICGIGLILAGLVINALLKPPPWPGWKPPSNPGAVTANNGLAPAGKDRTGPEKSEPPKVTGDATLDQALVDLEKGDSGVCLTAANKLVKIPPVPEHRALIAQKLAARATDPDANTRRSIIQALSVWGTTNEVPALIDSLNDMDFLLRSQTLQIIGKFRDERTLGPVSRCFADGVTRNDACKAFRDMGSMAENEVLPYLKSGDVSVRLDAVNVLKDIGTQASVPALKAVLAMDNAFTNRAAKDALAAIANRK